MDTGEGRFEHFEYHPSPREMQRLNGKYPESNKKLFYVGEKLEIKGSHFEIKDISPYGLKLKLLKPLQQTS